MHERKLVELDRVLNEARMAADDVAGALEHLADLYASLAVFQPCGGAEQKRLAATFSTLHARAAHITALIDRGLG
jgi:hypothetical protein